jgi:hypothetical protein
MPIAITKVEKLKQLQSQNTQGDFNVTCGVAVSSKRQIKRLL